MHVAESAVTAVTVYRRGAIVLREATVAPTDGRFPAQVRIDGLPLTLDDGSVQVEVVGAGPGAPIAHDLRMTVGVPPQDPKLPPPDDAELDAARLALAIAERRLQDLHRARARVDELSIAPRGEPEEGKPPQRSPTAARLGLLELRRARADALHARIEEAIVTVHEARERFETLQERRRIASDDRNVRTHEIRKAAVVGLHHEGAATAPIVLRLRYRVEGARWAPSYTVRLDREMTRGQLQVRALVSQATGEDWTNVALTLSTASPQQWTELPELRSMRIGRAQPPPPKTGWRPPPIGTAELYADYDRALGRRPVRRPGPPRPPVPRPSAAPQAAAPGHAVPIADEEPAPAIARSGAAPPGLAAPPPPPSAPPAPVLEQQALRARAAVADAMPHGPPMVAPASRGAKGGGLGSLIGGAVDGIAAAFGGGGGPAQGLVDDAFEPAQAASGIVAGRDLLDYARLSMPAAHEPGRGTLTKVGPRAMYQQVVSASVQLDVAFTQIRTAISGARALEARNAPARHHWPEGDKGFDYVYVTDAAVDVPSTDAQTSIPVLARASEATPRFVTVPRESQDVFRIVAFRNPLDAPLLPGPADVYVDGKFALTSDVELTPTGGRIELGLGVEQAIKIARNVEFAEDTAGLIKKHHELSHRIRIELRNNLARPALVEVRERLPVVPDRFESDIEVEVEDVQPPWEDYEPKDTPLRGGRQWRVEVPAGGSRELSAHWVAKIPNQHELIGGNRRES